MLRLQINLACLEKLLISSDYSPMSLLARLVIMHDGKLLDEFEVTTGVRQGCLLSPLLFLVVLDWSTRTVYASSRKGIQWTLIRKLKDLDFADDLGLLSHRLQGMQVKVDSLGETSQHVGLKINKGKTKVMRVGTTQEALK